MPDHPSTTLRDHLKPIPIPEAYHSALTKLRDERDFERRCNRILESKLREIINVTYESSNPAIGLTRIRGMAGACLRTYRQERANRKRTWRNILTTLMKKIVDKLLNIVSEIIVILYLLGLVAVPFVILLGAVWILVVLYQ